MRTAKPFWFTPIAAFLLLLSYMVACELVTNESDPVCGDIVCNGTETCETCEQDCGTCQPVDPFCGDNECNGTETCETCEQDCGICAFCGDNECNGTETCATCEQDCGICPFCGDNECNGTETCQTCEQDCGTCPPPGSNFQVNQLVEAEDGTLASPMTSATGGGGVTYISTGTTDQGSASYTYDILEDGDYYFESDVYASSHGANSFFVGLSTDNVNGNAEAVWDIDPNTTYEFDLVSHRGPGGSDTSADYDPKYWTLSPGVYTFLFYGRETDTRLNQITLRKAAPPACGDNICNGTEDCSTCAQDCGACPFCGDNTCDANEDCSTCEQDCGACAFCGDNTCDANEDCSTCEADCGTCPPDPFCGDNMCNGTESCLTCEQDCGQCGTGDTWYVDNAASGANSGTSWADAWQSFSAISWGSISAGDMIYISGGTTSKTYTEQMDVGKSGTAANRITIRKGIDAGHDGEVIIDSDFARSHAFYLSGDDYVIIRGFTIRDFSGSGGVRINSGTGVIIDNNNFYITDHGGVNIRDSNNCIISNNVMTTPTNTSAQTDGIYAQYNSNNIYEYNHIVITNENTNGHNDAMQLWHETDATVRYNYMEADNNKSSNSQGLYISQPHGHHYVYGNVITNYNSPNAYQQMLGWRLATSAPILTAYDNTIVGGPSNDKVVALGVFSGDTSGNPNTEIYNNIFAGTFSNTFVGYSGDIPPSQIHHNVYWRLNSGDQGNLLKHGGSRYSFSSWQSIGGDVGGMNVNPQFVDPANGDYRLQAGSAACGFGAIPCQ